MTPTRSVTPRRPASLLNAIKHTLDNRRHRCLNPSPVSRRPHPYHHPTLRTAIALEIHTLAARLIKVRRHKAVPPNPHPAALRTTLRPLPGILAPQSHQRLDAQIHKEYQKLVLRMSGAQSPAQERRGSPKPCPSLLSFSSSQNEKASFTEAHLNLKFSLSQSSHHEKNIPSQITTM